MSLSKDTLDKVAFAEKIAVGIAGFIADHLNADKEAIIKVAKEKLPELLETPPDEAAEYNKAKSEALK
jgi:hypothetical protein